MMEMGMSYSEFKELEEENPEELWKLYFFIIEKKKKEKEMMEDANREARASSSTPYQGRTTTYKFMPPGEME